MHRPILSVLAIAGAIILAGVPSAKADDRGAELAALEDRLLEAERVRVEFTITSEGILSSALKGSLDIRGDALSLEADGDFGGSPVDLVLAVSGTEIAGGNLALADAGLREFSVENPGAAKEAVILGMTRMGILHNLALLTGSRPPDRSAGGIREWVKTANVRGRSGGLAFDVLVDGHKAAEGVLALDARRLPTRREQTNRFEAGEMRVLETYRVFEVSD